MLGSKSNLMMLGAANFESRAVYYKEQKGAT